MLKTTQYITSIINELNTVMNLNGNNCVSPTVETFQILPQVFLDVFFKKHTIVLFHYSQIWITDILKCMLEQTEAIYNQYQSQKQTDLKLLFKLCLFYQEAAVCVESREITESEEIADEDLCKTTLAQTTTILSTDFGKVNSFIVAHVEHLLRAFGSHSKKIYGLFLEKLQKEFLKSISPKQLPQLLKPWIPLISSINNIRYSLEPISKKLAEIPKNYRAAFSNLITDTIINAFIYDGQGVIEFYNKGEDIKWAQDILDTIIPWNEDGNYFTWSTQLVLEMLLPSKLDLIDFSDPKSFHGRLVDLSKVKGNKKEAAITTLFIGFKIAAYSNCHPRLASFMNNFYESFLNFYLNTKREFKEKEISDMAHIDFPMYCLWAHKSDFENKILPIFLNEKNPDNWVFLARMIRIVTNHIVLTPTIDKEILHILISPTILLLSKNTIDPKVKTCIKSLFYSFQNSPEFFRVIIFQNDALKLVFKAIQLINNTLSANCFLTFFELKNVEENIGNPAFWTVVKGILEYLNETYKTKTLYKNGCFQNQVPSIIHKIAEYAKLHFQIETYQDKQHLYDIFKILTLLETDAIMFLASSNNEIRQKGVSIISSLLEIVHTSNAFDAYPLPKAEYQILISEARRAVKLTTAHNAIKNGLKIILEDSEAKDKAYNALFPYFLVLTNMLDPNIALVQSVSQKMDFTSSSFQEEWIGVISVLFAIVNKSNYPILINQLKSLLYDDGDLGAIISTAAPTSLIVREFKGIVDLIVKWIDAFQHLDGSFEVDDVSSTFIKNILKMVRGLAEQKQWTDNMINTSAIGSLMKKLVTYCDFVQGEDFRLPCVQATISFLQLLNNHSNNIEPIIRHQIAKLFIGWLSAPKVSKQYISMIYQALALLLNDLSLLDCTDDNDHKSPEEQASAQFLFYFASLKNRLDLPETDASEIIPILTSLLKLNLSIGIEHCISMGFANNDNVRAAFISGVAAVFKVPEGNEINNEENSNDNLIDIIFTGDWNFVEFICSCIPYSRAEVFGASMVEASILRGIEYEFLERMITTEVESCDEGSKNTLFRGNAVPAKAVGYFPRLVGTQWMTQTLKPVFEEVIKACSQGTSYVVDPSKLQDGEDLKTNQQNFRDLLNKFIDTIYDARSSMPESLIIEAKLIYEKVKAKFGDFAINILSGFLFLRFLLPAFNVPKLVGLPELLPPKPRTTLTSVSTVLMAALNQGKLNAKGEHLIIFNDIAEKANTKFKDMFLQIAQTEVLRPAIPINFNQNDIIKSLHNELYSVIPQITNGLGELEEQVQVQVLKLIQKLQVLGEPEGLKKPRRSTISLRDDGGKEGEAQLEELLKLQFSEEEIQEMNDFIVRDPNLGQDKSTIFYVFFDKLKNVKDNRIVPYLYIKTIYDEKSSNITMVNVLSGFDESKVPEAREIAIFAKMKPIQKIKKQICIQTPLSFVKWIKSTQLLNKEKHFYFIQNLKGYTDILGQLSKLLPPSTLQALSTPESLHKAIVNQNECQVRLHSQSIQLAGQIVTINSYKILPLTVIMIEDILNYTKSYPSPTKKDMTEFGFKTKSDGMSYLITVPSSSTLYESFIQLFERTQIIKNAAAQAYLKIDSSTLHWLMINIAFINMMNDDVKPIVKKAAIDLLYATYASFQFKREINITKVAINALPQNLIGYAKVLSEDLARNNPDSYDAFLTEYFKVYKHIDKYKSSTFIYLSSWIPMYANNIDKFSHFTNNLLNAFSELSSDSHSFINFIWPGIIQNPHAVEVFMNQLYKLQKDKYIEIVTGFGSINQVLVSQFWGNAVFNPPYVNDDSSIIYICRVLSVLFNQHLYDISVIPQLIYNFSLMRLKYSPEVLNKCITAFTSAIHYIIYFSGSSLPEQFTEITKAFSLDPHSDDIVGKSKSYPWLKSSAAISSLFNEILSTLPNKKLQNQLLDLFSGDFSSEDKLRKSQSIIFACAFASESDADQLIKILITIAMESEPIISNAVSIGLSLIKINKETAALLFIAGVILTLSLLSSSGVDLIFLSLEKYSLFDDCHNITSSIDPAILNYINESTSLDFTNNPIYSGLIVAAAHCDSLIGSSIKKLQETNINDKFVQALCLLVDEKSNDYEYYDFGEKNASINAALLLILKEVQSDKLIRYLYNRIRQNQESFSSFNALNSNFSTNLFKRIKDSCFLSLLIRVSFCSSDKYSLEPLLLPYYNQGMTEVQFSKEQFDYLLSSLFE